MRSLHGEGLSPAIASHYRSARACPSRSLDLRENRPQLRGPGRFFFRPMPGEAQDLALRAAGPLCFRSSKRKTPAAQRPRTFFDAIEPGEAQDLALR